MSDERASEAAVQQYPVWASRGLVEEVLNFVYMIQGVTSGVEDDSVRGPVLLACDLAFVRLRDIEKALAPIDERNRPSRAVA